MVCNAERPLLGGVGLKQVAECYQLHVKFLAAVLDIDAHIAPDGAALGGKGQFQAKVTLEFRGDGYAQRLLLSVSDYVAVVIHAKPVLYHPQDDGIRQTAGKLEVYGIAHYGLGFGIKHPELL